MLQAGLLQHPEVVIIGMIGRKHRAEDRDERQQRDDHQTNDRLALVAQSAQKAKLSRVLSGGRQCEINRG